MLLLVAVSIFGFIIIQAAPGDFITFYVQRMQLSGKTVSQEQIELMTIRYGLDQPLHIQYWDWITGFLHGDFGQSFSWGRPVSELVGERLFLTLVMTLGSLVIAWAIAIPVGVYSATHQYSFGDNAFAVLGVVGLAVPSFMLALVAMFVIVFVFDDTVGGLFSQYYVTAPWSWAKVIDLLKHMWLPVLIIATAGTAGLVRVMRANLLDVLGEQFVMTARAKGLREGAVVWKHSVRVAINPLISTLGLILPELLAGDALVSIVLNLPTVGPLYLDALRAQDMYLACFFLMFYAALLIIGNFLADIALAWSDPRISVR
jgi:peptide/nickel transport system permease protein